MSHIEEMIRELCPNGVEYKKLKNTTTITRGVRVVKSQLQSIGSYPVYQNSLTPMGYYDKYNCSANTTFEEFYKLKYCSTVVYMVPRA